MRMSCKILFVILIAITMLSFASCDLIAGDYNANNDAEYDVTFDSNTNSGQADIKKVKVKHNNTVAKPTDPIKVDYTVIQETNTIEAKEFVFIGWYSDEELKNRFDFTSKITENKTLYAKWRPVARSHITIGDEELGKTEEIYVIDSDKIEDNITVIKCEIPSFIEESSDTMYNGVFWGRPDVALDPFIMGRYEVTQELYETVMTGKTVTNASGQSVNLAATPWVCTGDDYPLPEAEDDDEDEEEQEYRPVENITWYDAVYFCNELTKAVYGATTTNCVYTITQIVTGTGALAGHITSANVVFDNTKIGYRLPTEAEWEFAARGGDTTLDVWNYMFGGADSVEGSNYTAVRNSGLDTIAWYLFNTSTDDGKTATRLPDEDDRSSWGTHQVGMRAANELGLFDMSGNVFEWCYDKVTKFASKNPTGIVESEDAKRITRGGSWQNNASKCVVTSRSVFSPGAASSDIGFRVVRSVAQD